MTMHAKLCLGMTAAVVLCFAQMSGAQTDPRYKVHDMTRPAPTEIDPGTASTPQEAGKAPSDAIVLFDGKDIAQWCDKDGQPSKWKVEHGYIEVTPHNGDLVSRQAFGDMQLHIEFAEPVPAVGEGQARGNSGVILMNQYEIQVLDSYHAATYPGGQVAAVYGQYPPQVNAARPPGEWQSYDIVFHGPRFAPDGTLTRKAHVTVIHNGVLVQDNVEIEGITYIEPSVYKPVPEKMPLHLQDHHYPVHFRNIWVRELGPGQ